MEAEYLMLCFFLGRVGQERIRKVANHILSKQRSDGSWGQYYDAPGDVSTSVECYFALKLAGYTAESQPLQNARRFILSRGGVPKVRVFTKIWLANVHGLKVSKTPMYVSCQKAITELGQPQSSVEGALRKAIKWFNDYGYTKKPGKENQASSRLASGRGYGSVA